MLLCYVYQNFKTNEGGSIGSQWIKISSFFVFKISWKDNSEMVVLAKRISLVNSWVNRDGVSVKMWLKLQFALQGRIQNQVKYLR